MPGAWKQILIFLLLMGAVRVVPAADDATTGTATLGAETGAQAAGPGLEKPHRLESILVRPLADCLRLIFRFDRPTPSALRLDLENRRAYLDLINVDIEYLDPQLARLGDERLDGVWLQRLDPGLATIELRLPVAAMRIEHFGLGEPPVVILDLFRADREGAIISRTAEGRFDVVHQAGSDPQIAKVTDPQISQIEPDKGEKPPEPALPAVWLRELDTATSASGEATGSEIAEGTGTEETGTEETTTTLAMGEATLETPEPPVEFRPIRADYDYFPIERIQMGSPLGRDILEDFVHRRWAMVINRGVTEHLKDKSLNEESVSVLYMIAEATYRARTAAPRDMVNLYEQALLLSDAGELGAFGHWRLAGLALQMLDYETALVHLEPVLAGSEPSLRYRARLDEVRALAALTRYDRALAQLKLPVKETLTTDEEVELARLEGSILLEKGDSAGAWAAYERASELDPGWINLDVEGTEGMARAAVETGHLTEAWKAIKFITDNFTFRDPGRTARLMLLYARVLEEMGDEANLKVAEATYHNFLIGIGDTAVGQRALESLHKNHPREMMEGESHYCLLLYRSGKIREAMVELNRIYYQSIREGITIDSLNEPIKAILPAYMEYANRLSLPFDTIQAWQLYSFAVKDDPSRIRCLPFLTDALEQIGLFQEALELVEQLKMVSGTQYAESSPRTRLQEARLIRRLGRQEEAIPRLESLAAELLDAEARRECFGLLAESYEAAGRLEEAAQAYQVQAESAGLDPIRRGETLLKSARLFLQAGMPLQTIELGIQTILLERQELGDDAAPAWPEEVGDGARLLLAHAYHARDDPTRAMAMLEDLLERPGITDADRAEARLRLADCQKRLGEIPKMLELLRAVEGDAASPPLYKTIARESLQSHQWDEEHPLWMVDWRYQPLKPGS